MTEPTPPTPEPASPELPELPEPPKRPKTPVEKALPGLLVTGSLAGVGAIMAGLLSLAPPVDDGSGPAPLAQPAPNTVTIENAGAVLPATVGPGGKNVPLTPARLDAPPPLAAAPIVAPIPPVKRAAGTKAAKVRPTRIRIPKIKVNAVVGSVTVDKEGTLGTPPLTKPALTGWYVHSPVPGALGPSVINGHVSTTKGAAVFYRLSELAKGDLIYVYRSDKKVTRFTVSGIEQVSKTTFPTARVYGNTKDAQLRLITCGGVFNKKAHSYTDNIVVYATLSKKKG
jgi:LPXTG-site transpeptidase (sortase) family protein